MAPEWFEVLEIKESLFKLAGISTIVVFLNQHTLRLQLIYRHSIGPMNRSLDHQQ